MDISPEKANKSSTDERVTTPLCCGLRLRFASIHMPCKDTHTTKISYDLIFSRSPFDIFYYQLSTIRVDQAPRLTLLLTCLLVVHLQLWPELATPLSVTDCACDSQLHQSMMTYTLSAYDLHTNRHS
jgi:hypothetical protein